MPRHKSRKTTLPSLNYRIGGFTLVEQDGKTRLIRVQQGGSLIVDDEGAVYASRPAGTPPAAGVNVAVTVASGPTSVNVTLPIG